SRSYLYESTRDRLVRRQGFRGTRMAFGAEHQPLSVDRQIPRIFRCFRSGEGPRSGSARKDDVQNATGGLESDYEGSLVRGVEDGLLGALLGGGRGGLV